MIGAVGASGLASGQADEQILWPAPAETPGGEVSPLAPSFCDLAQVAFKTEGWERRRWEELCG